MWCLLLRDVEPRSIEILNFHASSVMKCQRAWFILLNPPWFPYFNHDLRGWTFLAWTFEEKSTFYFCILLKDIVTLWPYMWTPKVMVVWMTRRLAKLLKAFFLETMSFRTVISRNLLDQLAQNFKYMCDYSPCQNQPKNFIFYILLGFRSLTKACKNR